MIRVQDEVEDGAVIAEEGPGVEVCRDGFLILKPFVMLLCMDGYGFYG